MKVRRKKRIGHYIRYKSQMLAYERKFKKSIHLEYLGTVTCPKCGKKGYAKRQSKKNIKTGHIMPSYIVVYHQHKEHGKSVHDGVCYIGKNL